MIGAATKSVQIMTTSICTCWTSLVIRVMSDDAPNVLTSAAENAVTPRNRAPRTSRPKLIAARGTEVDRDDREHDLDERDAEHDRPELPDVAPCRPATTPLLMRSALSVGSSNVMIVCTNWNPSTAKSSLR